MQQAMDAYISPSLTGCGLYCAGKARLDSAHNWTAPAEAVVFDAAGGIAGAAQEHRGLQRTARAETRAETAAPAAPVAPQPVIKQEAAAPKQAAQAPGVAAVHVDELKEEAGPSEAGPSGEAGGNPMTVRVVDLDAELNEEE